MALSLLATPLNTAVIEALAGMPLALLDLRRETGSPPQTTMRMRLRDLAAANVLRRRREDGFPGSVEYGLTEGGVELLTVAKVLATWLVEGPAPPGSTAARSTVKALVDGWSTNMLRALAARPLSLTELDGVITTVSYPSLERRLSALRLAGLVRPRASSDRRTPYEVTPWMRRAVSPLMVGARWEQRWLPGRASPITRRDIEAALLLALPLLHLPSNPTGTCRLAVETGAGGDAGVVATVRESTVVGCVTKLDGEVSAWLRGSAGAWFDAVIDRHPAGLDCGGDAELAAELVDGLHSALFAARATRQ